MFRRNSIAAIILFLLFFSGTASAKGYRITLATEKADTSSYVLGGWKWGDNFFVDTVRASKGKVIFRDKGDLECGQYSISRLSGKKLLEFIVPRGNRNFTISFVRDGKGFAVKKGNRENRIFSGFQNFVDYGWEKLDSREQFAARLEEYGKRASAECPGSITDIILKNTLFAPESAGEIEENFPFNDTIILNTRFAEDKMVQYLKLLQYNHNDTIIKHLDRLIAAGGNERLQNRLAGTAYEFFRDPEIMGQEGVAVHIAQQWYLSGRLDWPDPEGLFMLKTFVEFNRHSLIGMDAPGLALVDTLGNKVSLREMEGEYTIVYFYADDCPSCRRETPQLVDFVNSYEGGPLAIYAVYANDNEQRWKEYINRELAIYHPFMNWVNVYDPDFSSGFQMLYNVVGTPQMFLLDREKKIVGRGLNVKALKELLQEKNRQRDELRGFIGSWFEPIAGDTAKIREGIGIFYSRTSGDEELFREFFREIYYTLGQSQEYSLQEGAIYLAEKYITGMPQRWSCRFVEEVTGDVRKFNMNRLGRSAADLELEDAGGSPINLSDVTTDYKVLYFYRPNCGACAQTTPQLADIYNEYREKLDLSLFAINLGKGYTEWIEYLQGIGADWENVRAAGGDPAEIYGKYNLENIPTIYLLKDNVVVAKDIDITQLEETLKFIIQ